MIDHQELKQTLFEYGINVLGAPSIHLPADVLETLQIVAIRRARRGGGRPSVSAVIREAIEAKLDELEAEAG